MERKAQTRECKNKDLKQIKEIFLQPKYGILIGLELSPSKMVKEENYHRVIWGPGKTRDNFENFCF